MKKRLHVMLLIMLAGWIMGWTNSHLHSFNVGEDEYSMPYPGDDAYNEGMLDERKARLTDLVVGPKDRFVYVYDYGDNWEHTVELAEVKEPKKGVKYPVCLDGQRACPPEDCGGPWSYPEFLETSQGKDTIERQELIDWLGYEFDSEAFDVKEVNGLLRAGFRRSWIWALTSISPPPILATRRTGPISIATASSICTTLPILPRSGSRKTKGY